MNKWLERWKGLGPREQWLATGVAAVLLVMLYVLLVLDPLAARIAKEQVRQRLAETRALEAHNGVQELQARLAADPNLPLLAALEGAELQRAQLDRRIEAQTQVLLPPERMKQLLQELLRNQKGLQLVELQTFSEPLRLGAAAATPAPGEQGVAQAPAVLLHKHSLELRLEGGYFDLLSYLVALQGSEFRVYWDGLDYEVGDAGHKRASIILRLHTLSRSARFLGV